MKKLIVLLCIVCTTHVSAYSQEFWELLTPEMDVSCIDMNNQGHIYIGATDENTEIEGLYRSMDSGDNWELIYQNTTGYCGAVHCAEDVVYFGDRNVLKRFNELNETIDFLADILSAFSITSITQTSEGDLYYGSSGLYHSVDNGQSWDTLLYFESNAEYITDILAVENDTLFICTKGYLGIIGGVYRTVDGGETWEYVLQDLFMNCLEQSSDGIIYAGSHGTLSYPPSDLLMQSDDMGETWTETTTDINVWVQDVTSIPDGRMYCGTADGVYYSDEQGLNWEHQGSDIIPYPTSVDAIKALNDGHLYMVASHESAPHLYRSIDTIYTTLPKVDGAVETLTAFPNPASESITIQLPENTTSSTLQIIDINGRTVVQKQISSGESTVQLDVSSWNTGVYVARLISENRVMGRVKVLVK